MAASLCALLGFQPWPAPSLAFASPAAASEVTQLQRGAALLRPGSWAAVARRAPGAGVGAAAAAARGAVEQPAAAESRGCGLSGLGLAGLATAAAWRRVAGRRRVGRIVVRGRNYECNIKGKKGPAEAKKARITAKHLSAIILEVRAFGPNPDTNPGLARAIKLAMKDNVPRATVDGRIKKFLDEKESINEVVMGGYGMGGAAIMVECVTDNANRTRVDVKEAFKEAGAQVGAEGCVDHIFNKTGIIRFTGVEEEKVVEAAMEADIEDCRTAADGSIEVITLPEHLRSATEVLEQHSFEPVEQGIKYIPLTEATLNEDLSYEMKRLLYLLEEIDEVKEVHHNAILHDVELQFNAYGSPLPLKSIKKK